MVGYGGFEYIWKGRIKRLIICTKDGMAYKVYPSVPELFWIHMKMYYKAV